MDLLDLLAVQGTLKSLLQHHSSKASILQCSAFFTVQPSHPYMTTGKTIALTRRTFVGKVMSLLLNMLSRLVIIFLPRGKHLLISWLQSPSAVILEPKKIKSDSFHCFPIYLPWSDVDHSKKKKKERKKEKASFPNSNKSWPVWSIFPAMVLSKLHAWGGSSKLFFMSLMPGISNKCWLSWTDY